MNFFGGVKRRPKFFIRREVCEDGIVRFPRIRLERNVNNELSSNSKELEQNNHKNLQTQAPQYNIKFILGGVVFDLDKIKKLIKWGPEFIHDGKKVNPKLKPEKPVGEVLVADQLKIFSEMFSKLALEYYNRHVSFFGKKKINRQKFLNVLTCFKNIEKNNISLELFLRSQFELSKYQPRLLEPAHLSSINAITRYNNWIKTNFKTEQQANTYYQILNKTYDENEKINLQNILSKNHEQYLFLKKHNLTDTEILKLKSNDFHPLYMLTRPGFETLYDAGQIRVSDRWVEQYQLAKKSLAACELKKCAFLEIVSEVCRD